MRVSTAQAVLRQLHEKQAGAFSRLPLKTGLPLAAGAALVGGYHVAKDTKRKAQDYHAGFNPNYVPGGHE